MSLRHFRQWLRVVFVHDGLLWCALACFLCVWIFEWSLHLAVLWQAQHFAARVPETDLYLPVVQPMHQAALLIIAAIYGIYRAFVFHPLNNRPYGAWLAQTPWQISLPLPLGPIQLVRQDLAVVILLMLLALLPPRAEVSPWHVASIFLAAYCAVQLWTRWRLRSYRSLVAAVAVVACAAFVGGSAVALFLVLAGWYAITLLETRRTLQDFPFTESRRRELGLSHRDLPLPPKIGLPILPSRSEPAEYKIMRFLNRHAGLVGLAVGIVFFSIAFRFRDEPDFAEGLIILHRIIVSAAVAARTIIYFAKHVPPLSISGRIGTRQWIVPGYDVMFVAPSVTLVLGFIAPALLMVVGLPPEIAIPVSTAVGIWTCFGLRPTIDAWHYTGHFAIPLGAPGAPREYVRV